MNLEVIAIKDFPIIKENDNLPEIIYDSLCENNITLEDNDILVLAETVVSKAEGNYINYDEIEASKEAYALAIKTDKDPKQCQAILDQSDELVKMRKNLVISQTRHGFVCANAGIDNSNCEAGFVTPLPVNPDKSAQNINKYLYDKSGKDTAVIISDTQGRAFRIGAVGVAIGISGIHPCTDCRGFKDLYGNTLESTIVGTADELASCASLLMGQSDSGVCLVLIRGYDSNLIKCGISESSIDEILFDKEMDLFR